METANNKAPHLTLIPGGTPLERNAWYLEKALETRNIPTNQYLISDKPPTTNDDKIYCKIKDAFDVDYAVHRLKRGDGSYIYFHIEV